MRTVSLLHLLLVASLVVAVPYAEAGPVTGSALLPAVDNSANAATQSQESSQESAGGSASLFDAGGLPLLRMSAPIYLQLGTRSKLAVLVSPTTTPQRFRRSFRAQMPVPVVAPSPRSSRTRRSTFHVPRTFLSRRRSC